MLNKQFILEEWVPALRSGEYAQGRNALRRSDDSYCCLGVCADLTIKRLGLRWESSVSLGDYEIGGKTGSLPIEVMEFLGVYDKNFQTVLINMNDIGIPFPQIARYLEEYVEGA